MKYIFILQVQVLNEVFVDSTKKLFAYHRGRQTEDCGPNAALKVKICGTRAPFQPKISILKKVKIKDFVIKTYS